MDLTSIAVVVPVRDRPEMLSRALGSIKDSIDKATTEQAALQVEVIVVDDRSACTPRVPAGLDARVIRTAAPGPGAARNTGLHAARADWLLFTDSDCAVEPDWVLTAYSHITGSGEHIIQGNPTRYMRTTPLGALEEALYGHMYSAYVDASRKRTSMLDSRNLLARRDALTAVGGFDTSGADAMAESRVLAHRLLNAGFSFRYAEDLTVRHEAPRTIEDEMKAKFRHGRGRAGIWGAEPPSDLEMALRYFTRPMRKGIDASYVLPVHMAFLGGYAHEIRVDLPEKLEKVLRWVPEVRDYSSVVDFSLGWLTDRERQ